MKLRESIHREPRTPRRNGEDGSLIESDVKFRPDVDIVNAVIRRANLILAASGKVSVKHHGDKRECADWSGKKVGVKLKFEIARDGGCRGRRWSKLIGHRDCF